MTQPEVYLLVPEIVDWERLLRGVSRKLNERPSYPDLEETIIGERDPHDKLLKLYNSYLKPCQNPERDPYDEILKKNPDPPYFNPQHPSPLEQLGYSSKIPNDLVGQVLSRLYEGLNPFEGIGPQSTGYVWMRIGPRGLVPDDTRPASLEYVASQLMSKVVSDNPRVRVIEEGSAVDLPTLWSEVSKFYGNLAQGLKPSSVGIVLDTSFRLTPQNNLLRESKLAVAMPLPF